MTIWLAHSLQRSFRKGDQSGDKVYVGKRPLIEPEMAPFSIQQFAAWSWFVARNTQIFDMVFICQIITSWLLETA